MPFSDFRRHTRQIFWIVLIVFIIDQVTKWLAVRYLRPLQSIPILGNFFRLTYVENPGMAFGIQLDNQVLFHALSILALLIIFYFLFRIRNSMLSRTAFAVILGGALGNLTDRFLRGRVVDFFDVEFIDLHFRGGKYLFWDLPAYSMMRWPVFNIADMAVTIGMTIVLISTFLENSSQLPWNNANPE